MNEWAIDSHSGSVHSRGFVLLRCAVTDNRLPSQRFSRPTTKAGVPHETAPDEILREMLTLRIHLDDVTEENGPLQVVPESHRSSDIYLLSRLLRRCQSLFNIGIIGRHLLLQLFARIWIFKPNSARNAWARKFAVNVIL